MLTMPLKAIDLEHPLGIISLPWTVKGLFMAKGEDVSSSQIKSTFISKEDIQQKLSFARSKEVLFHDVIETFVKGELQSQNYLLICSGNRPTDSDYCLRFSRLQHILATIPVLTYHWPPAKFSATVGDYFA